MKSGVLVGATALAAFPTQVKSWGSTDCYPGKKLHRGTLKNLAFEDTSDGPSVKAGEEIEPVCAAGYSAGSKMRCTSTRLWLGRTVEVFVSADGGEVCVPLTAEPVEVRQTAVYEPVEVRERCHSSSAVDRLAKVRERSPSWPGADVVSPQLPIQKRELEKDGAGAVPTNESVAGDRTPATSRTPSLRTPASRTPTASGTPILRTPTNVPVAGDAPSTSSTPTHVAGGMTPANVSVAGAPSTSWTPTHVAAGMKPANVSVGDAPSTSGTPTHVAGGMTPANVTVAGDAPPPTHVAGTATNPAASEENAQMTALPTKAADESGYAALLAVSAVACVWATASAAACIAPESLGLPDQLVTCLRCGAAAHEAATESPSEFSSHSSSSYSSESSSEVDDAQPEEESSGSLMLLCIAAAVLALVAVLSPAREEAEQDSESDDSMSMGEKRRRRDSTSGDDDETDTEDKTHVSQLFQKSAELVVVEQPVVEPLSDSGMIAVAPLHALLSQVSSEDATGPP